MSQVQVRGVGHAKKTSANVKTAMNKWEQCFGSTLESFSQTRLTSCETYEEFATWVVQEGAKRSEPYRPNYVLLTFNHVLNQARRHCAKSKVTHVKNFFNFQDPTSEAKRWVGKMRDDIWRACFQCFMVEPYQWP
eukprot:SAG31_NODE_14837_length_785_cov_1.097668_2_plen_135_part_00